MLASTTGSTNVSGAPIAGTGTTQTSDKAPLVSKKNRLMRRVSGIFGTTDQPTTHDGYVEFGHLDSSNVNVGFAGFADSAQRTLGTFAGVFSPVALSMFSALVFIRVGYIVGNAGLLVTLLQFLIAYGILVFTVASVCAISTNGAVEGGGAYFMISRTLGPEFGGSIGTLFFLANIVGSALCISGFSEAIVENFGPSGYLLGDGSPGLIPDGRWYRFLYCSILNTINLCVCLVGASTFAKTSVAILAAVSICLSSTFISFFAEGFRQIPVPDENELIQNATYKVNVTYTGLSRDTLMSNLYSSYGYDYTSSDGHIVSFAATFGVLFSGVTGIMAGANMSGELKSPARSIPSGTLSAVLFTFIIYVALSILTAATCSRELLQNNYMYMMPINIWPPFVSIGVMTATFSASLSNLIGSSRVLEALAKDRVFGSFLNFVIKGTWHSNPIAAVLVSWFLVQIMFFVGSLNAIAQINSVLFLLSYLATNMACLGLQLASAPNFRPSFKCFTWHTASVGLFGTIAMMFVINPVYSSCSIALCVALVACLHFFGSEVQGEGAPYWGSISQALIFHQVRKYLLLLDSRKDHVKYWRPQILLLVSNPRACCPLIDFVNDIKKGGLYVLGHVFVSSSNGGDISTINPDLTQEQYPHWLELVDHLKIKAFVELTEARSVRDGFQHLVRISGMGAMKPNTVILGFYDDNIPIDFLTGETSYKTDLFDKTSDGAVNENIFKLRHRNEAKKYLDVPQYVSMIKDGLALGKNVCVCRHFDKLDKNALLKNSKIKYMDVWAVNALAPRSTAMAAFDTTALFMMQLAVICRMVGLWKRMAIRVYIATTDETVVHRLQELLKLLRIRATIHEVPNWSSATDLLQGESVMLNSMTNTYDFDTDNSETIDHYEDVHERSNTYKYLTRFNELIRLNSQNTAVTFLYMPAPPGFVLRNSAGNSDNSYDEFSYTVYGIDSRNNTQSRKSNNYDKLNKEYLNVLSILTEQLPPTVLVHGLNTVTSTTL